ncbi:MAG TPA: NAD(P)-dependent oxidoreductase [Acidimicrobiales bacterium]|nr:NAD(P)-dependent oxidoreductase [Acidimicrobiales bacterium]
MAEPIDRTSFYPVMLDLSGRRCLVVGGGVVAARKARSLLESGAIVTVLTPALSSEMESLVPSLQALKRKPYEAGDVSGYRLVVTATGTPAVDRMVYDDAESHGIWVNSSDDPAHSSFILPAVFRDGDVTVSVSTGGLSPALAVWLRDRIEASSGSELGTLAQVLGEARHQLRQRGVAISSVDWRGLLDGPLPALVEAGELDRAVDIIDEAAGL